MEEDVEHIYSGILVSHKKNEILPFATMGPKEYYA